MIILLILVGLLMAFGFVVLIMFAWPVSAKTRAEMAAHQTVHEKAQVAKEAARVVAVEAEVERLRRGAGAAE
ncbi:hypothetical protein [Cryobacterium aureum]|uniref:hypothetical protein n=1 Tax=Cryobacterium aureum TaxID=995037 RepID=UPI000CF51C51|nr:hypothetical protein [Cryobacterium aureum]